MFQFNINLTDEDYFEYNKYITFHTPAGKKQMRKMRILIAVLSLLIGVSVLLRNPIDTVRIIAAAVIAAAFCAIFQAVWKPLMALSIKTQLKRMKKNGKLPYYACAELTFDDDAIRQTTETSRSEEQYRSVERICRVPGKVIYIFIDSARAYLLPAASFASQEEVDAFISFLEAKTGKSVETIAR